MLSRYGNCMHLLKIKNKLKIGCFYKEVQKNSQYFVGVSNKTIGNLRTTMKFTTTTSVDWEKTGMGMSVLAGKRKLKMQSVSKSTMTTLNVNTNVKL